MRLPVDSFRLATRSITPWPHDQPVRILVRILWAWPILARWHGLWTHHVPDLAASLGGMRGLLGAGGAPGDALAAGIETVRTFEYTKRRHLQSYVGREGSLPTLVFLSLD